MSSGIKHILDKAVADDGVKGIILTSGKQGVFVAGGLDEARRVTTALFSNDLRTLSARELRGAFTEASHGMVRPEDLSSGISLASAVTVHGGGMVSSASELRRLVSQGAIKVNGKVESDPLRPLTAEDFIDSQVMVVQRGKKSHDLIWLEPDQR